MRQAAINGDVSEIKLVLQEVSELLEAYSRGVALKNESLGDGS